LELSEGRGTGTDRAEQAEEKVETLADTLGEVEAKVLADRQGDKLKEVE